MKKIKKKQEKRKIKAERKSLISETIDGLSIMTNQLSGNRRENEDDDEEMDGLIRTTSSSGGRSNTTTTRNTNNNSKVWKILAFVLFAILILFATDVIEFKEATHSSSIHSDHNKNSSSSEIAMIDGSIEQKEKPNVVVSNTEKSNTENTKVEEEELVLPPLL